MEPTLPNDNQSPTADIPILDATRLATLRNVTGENGRPFLFEFVKLFETDATERIAGLRAAIAGGTLPQLSKQAHPLKGSCRNVGAARMAAECQALEQSGEEVQADEAERILARIESSYLEVRDAIRQLVE
jgi:HPt (histidine-containing phosphotransfer) domain-containing protein